MSETKENSNANVEELYNDIIAAEKMFNRLEEAQKKNKKS
jgi:hypothetical protein